MILLPLRALSARVAVSQRRFAVFAAPPYNAADSEIRDAVPAARLSFAIEPSNFPASPMTHWLIEFWPHLTASLAILLSLGCAGHAVLYKKDVRSTIGWVGIVWLAPIVGSALYLLFGINRIRRKAHFLRKANAPAKSRDSAGISTTSPLGAAGISDSMLTLEHVVNGITGRPLLAGNRVTPLFDGDQAYPAMLAAIDTAQQTISLSTYIFNNDSTGKMFLEALERAVLRGVDVRVIVDAIGARYTFPSIVGPLRRRGIKVQRFLRSIIPGWFAYANLRNHRKILVIDGKFGFTGGMNIRAGGWTQQAGNHPLHDLHFSIAGPVVQQLQDVFADDWLFCTREEIGGPQWFPEIEAMGETPARGISDGPDEDLGKLRMTYCGAIACAQRSISICTPYFLPDESLVLALNVAAMRGVQVDILLPENNNLALVQWASAAMHWQLLQHGCRIWLSPGPFDHTKLLLVDGLWTLVGSGNWDPRSLRLNFEFNVECYGPALAEPLEQWFRDKLSHANPVTLAKVDGRSLWVRLRDGVARLLTPYL